MNYEDSIENWSSSNGNSFGTQYRLMMGHAAPIAEGLVKGDFLTATALSRLNRRNYKRSKYLDIAEVIDYYACFMANTILAINGKKRRIKHR